MNPTSPHNTKSGPNQFDIMIFRGAF